MTEHITYSIRGLMFAVPEFMVLYPDTITIYTIMGLVFATSAPKNTTQHGRFNAAPNTTL